MTIDGSLPAILRWAAGADAAVPSTPEYDGDALLQATLRHKLTGRLLKRMARRQPPWMPDAVLARLRDQQAAIRRSFDRRLKQMREIAAALDGRPEPLAVLKGITAFVVTGSDDVIRNSGDVDLLWADPEALRLALLGLGYRDSDDYCRSHEYASLYLNDMNADIHRHFPVPTLAAGQQLSDIVLADHPRRWRGLTGMVEQCVSYDDLRANSVTAVVVGSNVLVADASLAVFLLCAHAFREFCHTPFLLPFATLRLGELCETQDLLQAESFDATRLHHLVGAFSGEQAMRYAAYMLRSQLGSTLLDEYGDDDARFPFDLWLPGFTVADDRAADPDAVLMRPHQTSFSEVLSGFGSTVLEAGDEAHGPRRLSSEPIPNDPTVVGRTIVNGEPPPIVVSCRWGSDVLSVNVEVLGKAAGTEAVLVNFGDISYEVAFSGQGRSAVTRRRRHAARPKSPSGSTKWKASVPTRVVHGADRHLVQLELAWEPLLARSADSASVAMLVGMRREGTDEGGVLLPLQLHRP